MIADAVKAHRFVKALWAACEKEIIMTISEKVAYLKGLAEGLDLDTAKSKEGKLISVMIGILEEIGMSIEDLEENTVALGEEIDAISDDLSDVEKAVFDEDDDDDDCCCGDEEDDFFEVDCPNCGDTLMIDESVLEEGVIQCPGCRQKFALDLSDDCCCGDGDEDGCGCGCEDHDHDHEDHDHDHEEHEHHHDHDHEEHEHHHDHDHECGCGCGHHHHDHEGHHHADDVFTSWGKETIRTYTKEEIGNILKTLEEDGSYGNILRAKGMVAGADGEWIYFDMVPGEHEVRTGAPEYTGRICVIGAEIKEDKLAELFQVK